MAWSVGRRCELALECPRAFTDEQRDFVAARRFARQQRRQLRLERRQVGALALEEQPVDEAALDLRLDDRQAVLHRRDLFARHAHLTLRGPHLEEAARHIARQADPRQIQQRALPRDVGVSLLDGRADPSPEIQFP